MDATTVSLEQLADPKRYEKKEKVPWFRCHKRKRADGTEIVVTEQDLREIAEHMQAMERDGRLFRLTNGHINPVGDEDEQPELLGFGRSAVFGLFGPQNEPAVLVDEYADKTTLGTLKQRPYRSAEYYPGSKKITGAAALIRDPELNLGTVLYANDEPWHYAESIKMEPADANDPSPEQAQQYEGMCRYLAKKFPKLFGPEAMGATNGAPPEPVKKPEDEEREKQEQLRKQGESPELYAVRLQAQTAKNEADAAKRETAKLRQERETEKCERIVEKLATRYRMDPAREVRTLLPLTPAEREAHVAYIKAHYSESPDAEPIEVYSGRVEGGPDAGGPAAKPADHDKIMTYMRRHGCSYEDAEEAVRK